jgi:hypothetical protein
MKMKLFFIATTLVFVSMAQAYASLGKEIPKLSSGNYFADSLQIHTYTLRKNNIRLSPNPTSSGRLSIISTGNEDLYFYVFDLEGTILHRFIFKGKEKRTITGLKKGVYTYDVFRNDESIEQGKIIVK